MLAMQTLMKTNASMNMTPRTIDHRTASPAPGHFRRGRESRLDSRRGFTLVELLVVMAISVILLGLIFGPMLSSFNFVTRAEQTADAQETARRVMQQVTREVKDAVRVSVAAGDILVLPQSEDERIRDTSKGVRHLGYINAYDERGRQHQLFGALLDFLPPDDTLGLHGGQLATPSVPQVTANVHTHEAGDGRTRGAEEPHNVIIRYFVGLQDPGFPHTDPGNRWSPRTGDAPVWSNSHIQTDVLGAGGGADNPYILYRIEFDAEDPAFSNWAIPGNPRTGAGLVINPNFFYDSAIAPNGEPYWENWKRNAVALTPVRNVDLVRFSRDANGVATQAQSTVTFTPTSVQNDAAVPATGLTGSPVTYLTKYGNWTGVQNDGSLTALGFSPPAVGVFPHITVYEPVEEGAGDYNLVYDNWETNRSSPAYPGQSRHLTWDSRNGAVMFKTGGQSASGDAQPIRFQYTLGPADPSNGWKFDLIEMAEKKNAIRPIPASLRPYVKIVPESTQITLTYRTLTQHEGHNETSVSTPSLEFQRTEDPVPKDTLERPAWWQGNPAAYPPGLPPHGKYFINPTDGLIWVGFSLAGNGPPHPIPLSSIPGPGGQMYYENPVLDISFAFQTNMPDDIVKVDYGTKSLLNTTLGIRMFDPSTSRPIVVQLSDRIAMRNMGRR